MTGLPEPLLRQQVAAALAEDLGQAGDITSAACIPAGATARAGIMAREPGVMAGLAFAEITFQTMDKGVTFTRLARDGAALEAGQKVARVEGPARSILAAERVALNYLCHLSGIATATARLVRAVGNHKARVADTRKTLPGLRAAQKYAVRMGGGVNHRFGLHDAVLIKDNHIAACGGDVALTIARARAAVGHLVRIEVEIDRLDQLDAALAAGVDAVLLDNMTPDQLAQAVTRIGGRCIAEASGGVTEASIAAIAASGVDLISVGALTHSARALDLGLDFSG